MPNGGNKDAALHNLKNAQKRYTKGVEAFLRHQNRAGGSRRPANTVEVGMALLASMNRIANTLDGIHDCMRYTVSRPSF